MQKTITIDIEEESYNRGYDEARRKFYTEYKKAYDKGYQDRVTEKRLGKVIWWYLVGIFIGIIVSLL